MKPILLALCFVFFLSACAETEFLAHMTKQLPDSEVTTFKVGNPYKISGRTYYPKESYTHSETGIASWYGPNFHAKRTANGETYDMYDLTAAHRTLQIPSIVKVTNLENGRSIKVRINDRGPFARDRVIDMSKRGAELLGYINQGTARVRIEVLPVESRIVADAAKAGRKINVSEAIRMAKLMETPGALQDYQTASVSEATINKAENSLTGKPLVLADKGEMDVLQQQAEPFQAVTTVTPVSVEEIEATNPNIIKASATAQDAGVARPVSFKDMIDSMDESKSALKTTEDVNQVELEPVLPNNLYIQAGSFSQKTNATALAGRLKKYGQISVQEALVNNRTFYRVRVGPLASVETADTTLARMWEDQHLQDARIIVD